MSATPFSAFWWLIVIVVIVAGIAGTGYLLSLWPGQVHNYHPESFVCVYTTSTNSTGFKTIIANGQQTVTIPAPTTTQEVNATTTYLNGGYCPP